MTDLEFKFVNFEEYCPQCKHELNKEHEEPCDECLMEPVNQYSHKPVKFEPKTK